MIIPYYSVSVLPKTNLIKSLYQKAKKGGKGSPNTMKYTTHVSSAFFFCLLLLLTVFAVSQEDAVVTSCSVGKITMSGAEGAQRVVEAWKEAYVKKCPDVNIETEGGGYPLGAARVCGNHRKLSQSIKTRQDVVPLPTHFSQIHASCCCPPSHHSCVRWSRSRWNVGPVLFPPSDN